jgi:hypothetical protein
MTALPAKGDLDGTTGGHNQGMFKTAIGNFRDWAAGLFGTAGTVAGALDNFKVLDPQAIYNLSIGFAVGSNALTATIKDSKGADLSSTNPGFVMQRHATLSNGTMNLRALTANISTVISSGSTAGHASATEELLHWYLIDNAGVIELAWSTTDFGESGIVSTSAEGGAGAADSATTMYSTTARSNVPFRKIARTKDTQTTAGLWAAIPSEVQVVPYDVVDDSIQQNSQSAAYTAVFRDANKQLLHPSSDNNPRTFTIPANSAVPYKIGTTLMFVNKANTLTIAITSDTLTLAESGSTGSRTLTANGVATAVKIATTEWLISGVGLS